jgi:tripartite-type tricarboxylate transporter receptor subunit TctC
MTKARDVRRARALACTPLFLFGALAFASCFITAAFAQNYPTQPVKVLLPYAAGGVADITARVLAQRLSQTLGQQIIIDNRPSAGQIVASEAVMKADPDGYTLLWLNQGHAVSVSLFKSLPYDPVRDFAPISTVGFFGLALLVNSDSPYRSLKEFIAAVKANPGKFNVGTTSIGSTQYVSAELFKSMAGLDFQTVPFKATPMIITSVKGNDLQAMVEILAPVIPHIKSGNLRALGVTFDHRFAGLPEVPTLAEAGVPGYEASAWNGVAAPAKTPRAVIERLNREINAVVAVAEVRQRLQDLGVDARASTPEALRELLISETAKWKAVVERAKIEKQ